MRNDLVLIAVLMGAMAARRIPLVNLVDVARLASRYGIAWDPTAPPVNQDLPGPPPHPFGVLAALALLIAVVVAVHRAGLFRVPAWDLPESLGRPALPREPARTGARR